MTDFSDTAPRSALLAATPLLSLGLALVAVAAAPLVGGPAVAGTKALWLLSAFGVASLVAGLAGAAGRWAFGGVAAALILGGTGQLWLTEPLWFPKVRLRPDGLLDALAVLLIAGQGLVAIGTLWKTGALLRFGTAVRAFGVYRPLLILLLATLVSLSPMGFALGGGHWESYAIRLVLNAAVLVLDALTIAALLSVPAPAMPRGISIAPSAALFAVIASAALAWWGFDRLPHVEDETVYMLQAKMYAAGALAAPAPPGALQPAIEYYLLDIRDGLWIPTPPPGWPAILAVGVFLGAAWLVNPVLAGATVLAAHGVAFRLWGRQVADLAAILLATSPWFLGAAGSLMPHVSSLLLVLVSWLLLLRVRDRGALPWALVAGLAMGWVFVIRQLEGVILGGLTGLWLLGLVREHRGFVRGLLYATGCVIGGLAFFLNNLLVTGNALVAPLGRYINEDWGKGGNGYGFGRTIGPPEGWGGLDLRIGHDPFEGLMNMGQSFAMLDMDLFGWCVGSLALVWIALLYRKPDRASLALLAVVLSIIVALFFYWFSGAFYIGPRYWFMTLFPMVALSALGFGVLSERLSRHGLAPRGPAAALAVLCVFSVFVFTPWRGAEKYNVYGSRTNLAREAGVTGDVVVFVDVKEPGAAFMLNDPFLRPGQPIYLRDGGEEANAAALEALPGRTVRHLRPSAE